MAAHHSERASSGLRTATDSPRGSSLIRCHIGNTLFQLSVGGKTQTTSAVFSGTTRKDTNRREALVKMPEGINFINTLKKLRH